MYKTLKEIQQDSNVENKKIENMTNKELRKYLGNLVAALYDEDSYDGLIDLTYENYYYGFYDTSLKDLEKECELLKDYFIFLTKEQQQLVEQQINKCEDEIVKRATRIEKQTRDTYFNAICLRFIEQCDNQ